MENIKLFEQFVSEESKVSISITVSSENPDAKWDFVVTGVGNDKKEAAILALGAALGVNYGNLAEEGKVTGSEEPIIDFEEAMEYLEDYGGEAGVDLLLNDSLPSDYFGDHGTDSNCTVETGTSNMEIAGYVISSSSEEFY
jgi:hypothetical protein